MEAGSSSRTRSSTIVKAKAALADADGFVLDGYPRNLDQAEYLSGSRISTP